MAGIIAVQMFGVEVTDDKGVTTIKNFTSEADAQVEVTRQKMEADVTAYANAKGLSSKVGKTRMNVIIDYMAWVEAGRPAAPPKEELAEEEDLEAEEVLELEELPAP